MPSRESGGSEDTGPFANSGCAACFAYLEISGMNHNLDHSGVVDSQVVDSQVVDLEVVDIARALDTSGGLSSAQGSHGIENWDTVPESKTVWQVEPLR